MKFEQSFKKKTGGPGGRGGGGACVHLSACVFRDGRHLLAHFPRRLFVKLCLAPAARMCHEAFR